jgi:hypothetical protein
VFRSVLIFVVLVAPFHLAQYSHTGSIGLSCYSGCNLAEVFPQKRDCVAELGRLALDSPEGYRCCRENANFVLQGIRENPMLLRRVVDLDRVAHVLAPSLYWHAWAEDRWFQSTFGPLYSVGMYVFWLVFLALLIRSRRRDPALALAHASMLAGMMFFILVSHNGTEMVRVILPLHGLAFLAFFSLLPARPHETLRSPRTSALSDEPKARNRIPGRCE